MKPTNTKRQAIYLFKMLDITTQQFEQAQAWYKNAKTTTCNNNPKFNLTRINNARYIFDKKS